jgi:predicted transcriptional regulator
VEIVTLDEWRIEETKKAVVQADAGDFATEEEATAVITKWTKCAR